MNTEDTEFTLRRVLRDLPRERDPAHDLWPGVAARIGTGARLRRRSRWPLMLALAASTAFAAVLVWRPQPSLPEIDDAAPVAHRGSTSDLLLREAEAVTLEYRLALQTFEQAPLPPAIAAAVTELDASALQIRDALRSDPGASFLLERLRHTYERRLQLTQRATLS